MENSLPSHFHQCPLRPPVFCDYPGDRYVGYSSDGWYFWNETEAGAFVIGPFSSFVEAEAERTKGNNV